MLMKRNSYRSRRDAFTLIELLTVVAIISLLISILLPSLSRAREQAKSTHCLARLKDFANGLAAYENLYQDQLPPAEWVRPDPQERNVTIRYGWTEILFSYVYGERNVFVDDSCPPNFTVQRNIEPRRWDEYFLCRSATERGPNSGHYRVYLPFWGGGQILRNPDGTYAGGPSPYDSSDRTALNPKKPLIGDANDQSERGDGDCSGGGSSCESCTEQGDDCSYIDAGEANIAGTSGYNGNRFSDRHSAGTNYLFADFHGEWRRNFREQLAIDWDLNEIFDVNVEP
ncbi:MAG: prepilin-type N-terminal cleavage/methylation domain-containing protein [Phycisphaerales bacterium]|nr:MAG: prepilin-type N-terminal cleavage/methylation domain-containing protein [Phycisphaerales bacterium]